MKWKILSSEYLFRDLWFKVRRDKCVTPSGKIVEPYYVYEFPNWVTAVALTEDNQVILEMQYRHGLGETGIEIPGGCVDDTDVDYEAAIRRELMEETGYTFDQVEYLGVTSANPSTNSNVMHMFLARGGKKTTHQQLDPNEEIEIRLASIDELKELVRSNKIVQSMHTTCILYALEKLGELKY
ncbi:MAG: NUDIX hydrolase [Chitinophagaceae bacterium]|nr:MAG: NUDIX hydrolase [Chitinophagaceae bacterium]